MSKTTDREISSGREMMYRRLSHAANPWAHGIHSISRGRARHVEDGILQLPKTAGGFALGFQVDIGG
jgi:hypothetical protein